MKLISGGNEKNTTFGFNIAQIKVTSIILKGGDNSMSMTKFRADSKGDYHTCISFPESLILWSPISGEFFILKPV